MLYVHVEKLIKMKRILYCLLLCIPVCNAEPAMTQQWVNERGQMISKLQASIIAQAQASLEAVLPAEEESLPDKIAALEQITADMLEEAVNKRQLVNQKVEILRFKRQEIQANVDQFQERLVELNETLKELTQYPRAELTVAQNQRIAEVEKALALQQQAIELEQQYLGILNGQMVLAIKEAAFAIEWHIQLQSASHQPMLQERAQMIAAAQAATVEQEIALETAQNEQPIQIATLKSVQVTVEELTKILEQAVLDKESAELDISNFALERQNIEIHLEKQRQSLKEQQDKLEALRESTEEPTLIEEKRISEQDNHVERLTKMVAFEEQTLEIINRRVELAGKRLQLATELHAQLQPVLFERQKLDLEAYLQKEQQRQMARVAYLQWELNKMPHSEEYVAQHQLLKIKIQEANERYQQIERQLETHQIQKQLAQWEIAEQPKNKVFSQEQLDTRLGAVKAVNHLLEDIHALHKLLQDKITFLEREQKILAKSAQAQKIVAKLKDSMQQELNNLPALQAKAQEILIEREKAYQKHRLLGLLVQRQLPTNTPGWQRLFGEIAQSYTLFIEQLKFAGHGFMQAFQQIDTQRWYTIGFIMFIWLAFVLGIMLWLGQRIKASIEDHEPLNLLGSRLLHLNPLTVAIVGVGLLLLFLIKPNPLTVTITLIVLLTWLAGKFILNWFWLWLAELDPKTYQQLRWRIIFLGILTIITALVHVEPQEKMLILPFEAIEFIDSVFMTLLFLLVLPLLRIRKVILTYLRERIGAYWRFVISLIALFVPLTILAISISGLMGYITLAWAIVKQLSLFLLVLIPWLIAVGILANLMNSWKNFIADKNPLHDLWRKDIIPLVQQILELILFVFAVFALFRVWGADIALNITQLFEFTLFSMGDIQITIGAVVLSILIIWFIFWLGSWTRGVTYRWVYLKVTDIALRTSLSILTQYAIIIIGLLIVLSAIGIDPTVLAVFAGAVGVGLAFGLQTILASSTTE